MVIIILVSTFLLTMSTSSEVQAPPVFPGWWIHFQLIIVVLCILTIVRDIKGVNVIQINGMETYWVVLELTPPTKNGREESFANAKWKSRHLPQRKMVEKNSSPTQKAEKKSSPTQNVSEEIFAAHLIRLTCNQERQNWEAEEEHRHSLVLKLACSAFRALEQSISL